MSRKLLALLVAGLTLLALATYVYYRRTLAAVPVDAYALVPDDAVLVLATRDHPALVRHLQEAGVWDNLTGVRYYQQVAGQLALADSLDTGGQSAGPNPVPGRRHDLLALLGNKLVLTSLHVTGPRQVEVLYQLPLATVREYRQARGVLETLARDPRYTLATRMYQGYELEELTQRGGERLTVLDYRNHLVLSTHAPLVEAVVQRLEHPDAPTVRAGFGSTDLLRLADVDATVLVNFRRLPALLDVLFQPGTHAQLDQAFTLTQDGLLGLKFGPGQLTLTGFANPETAAGSWQRQLQGQPPQPVRPLADVLPLQAALVLSVAGRLAAPATAITPARAPAATTAAAPLTAAAPPTAAIAATTAALAASTIATATAARPAALADSSARYGAALDSLRATLAPGGTLVYLAAPAPGQPPPRLVLLRSLAPARTTRWLAWLRRAGRVSPAFGRVGGYAVYEGGPVGAALLGAFTPAPAPATAQVGSYLALGTPADLRIYLAEVAAHQTWSRSATQVALLQQLLPQARLTVLADLRLGWNALLGTLAEDRRAGLLRNEGLLRHYSQVAWQLLPPDHDPAETAPGAQYYEQLLLRHPSQVAADTAVGAGTGIRLGAALAGRPLLLPADANGTPALVLADSAGVLRRMPLGGRAAVWADSLPGPVVGTGSRLLRGRLLLATAHRLHWLDPATGIQAPNFPLNLPDSLTIATVAVAPNAAPVPHLLVATADQDLLLYDTNGHQYSGWPHHLEAPLAGPPLLLLVGGRDVVVAALTNGYVYAFDQAGGRYPGFPVSAGARLAGPLLAQAGATLARSTVRLVNQHGELLTLSLSGDVTARRRVATWSRTAEFRLVPEATGRAGSFVVVRQDGAQLDVFAPPAAAPALPLLSLHLLTSGQKPVQWFNFNPGHQVLAVTEPGPAQVRLFDGQGRPLGRGAGTPLAAGTWPSTGTGIGLLYDAAGQRYLLLRYQRRTLWQDAVSVNN